MDLRSSECDVVSLYAVCCSVNVSVCFVCCVFDSVYELFGETIRNVFGCSCYFLLNVMNVFSVCGLPKSVCVVPLIPMSVQVLLPYVLFVFLYVGSYLLI